MEVRFAEAALADIDSLRSHIALDNPPAANRMAVAIVAAIDRLEANPRLGRVGAVPGAFELVVRPYIVVYEIIRTEIVILRVWHER